MNWDVQQIVIALVGGGGITALATKLWQIVKEHGQGKLDKEDTAIARWQQIAEKAEEDAAKDKAEDEAEIAQLKIELSWYRVHYGKLWAAYAVGPPPRFDDFPSSYTSD